MTEDDAWLCVARECPRRIVPALHRCGEYLHGTTARYPGKVLCCRRDADLPAGWVATAAQQQASQVSQGADPVPPGPVVFALEGAASGSGA